MKPGHLHFCLQGWLISVILCSSCQPQRSAGTIPETGATPSDQSKTKQNTTAIERDSSGGSGPATAGIVNNVMNVTVNGSLCGDHRDQWTNQPCTSITLCQHGTSNCQTINNIIVDTGSSGLHIFSSLVTIPTTPVMAGANKLAECIGFSSGVHEWGQVAYVDVKLAGEPAVQVPIHLVDSTFARPPANCSSPQVVMDENPQSAGANGVLGVGLFNQDCGLKCATDAANGMYYACSSTSCMGTTTAVQVQNPVALLPVDNNGVVLQFPSVEAGGVPSVTGTLTLGIGTQPNNTPTKVTKLSTNAMGQIYTVFADSSDKKWPAIISSGVLALNVPSASALKMPTCTLDDTVYFCPPLMQTATATNWDASGTVSSSVTFQVSNANTLFRSSSHMVFSDLALEYNDPSNEANNIVGWGLEFYFGRAVYTGIDGMKSILGTGPYYAY